MNDPVRRSDGDAEPPPSGAIDDGREEMARIAESLSALIGRMMEFQEELEPFLRILAEPEPEPESEPPATGPNDEAVPERG
ncbi:hypothetical protein [Planctomyces sp. SH-PL62]|uniref:hypothetical protein n=1 Tax=Planctomyces sp. SH-PL62 TaxID=1636152 RepID=UPI00078ECAD1|nr:hypothetical protein [Planctomyces sp. SH-PL62]AMV40385.1 hypothetical protein VT85_23340 [Planctomyces sp. SH-PL62]